MNEVEQRLYALGRELELPEAPDLVRSVGRQLDEQPGRPLAWRRAVGVALIVLAVALGAALAVPRARTTILKWFHLRGATVERVDTLPSAVERSRAGGLGRPLSRGAAERSVGFKLVLPPVEGGSPKVVYVLDDSVASVVLGRHGRPVLLSEFRSSNLAVLKKSAGDNTAVEGARVGGDPALWLEGGPHTLTYVDRGGGFRERAILIHGNVLLWVHGPLTLRLEGSLTKDEALALARLTR